MSKPNNAHTTLYMQVCLHITHHNHHHYFVCDDLLIASFSFLYCCYHSASLTHPRARTEFAQCLAEAHINRRTALCDVLERFLHRTPSCARCHGRGPRSLRHTAAACHGDGAFCRCSILPAATAAAAAAGVGQRRLLLRVARRSVHPSVIANGW